MTNRGKLIARLKPWFLRTLMAIVLFEWVLRIKIRIPLWLMKRGLEVKVQ